MNTQGLKQVIATAAQARDSAISQASKNAPDYAAYDAACSAANASYRRVVDRAYARVSA